MVVAIDAKRAADGYDVYVSGGRERVEGREAVTWAREATERGAGEVLLTSMDRDGTADGYELELTRSVRFTGRPCDFLTSSSSRLRSAGVNALEAADPRTYNCCATNRTRFQGIRFAAVTIVAGPAIGC